MNQERALLHFTKFKAYKNEYMQDTFSGIVYKINKIKLKKISDDNFEVILYVTSELEKGTKEIDSAYAHINFKALR